MRRNARTGQPKLAAVAAVLLDHPDDIQVPILPPALARGLLSVLAARAR